MKKKDQWIFAILSMVTSSSLWIFVWSGYQMFWRANLLEGASEQVARGCFHGAVSEERMG